MADNRVRILEVKERILLDNDADAAILRKDLTERKIYYINLMSSPGSGKTTTLLAVCGNLREHFRIGIMEADIDSDVDAVTMQEAGFASVQLHTGGMCHLSADMSRQGLRALYQNEAFLTEKDAAEAVGAGQPNVVFLENVGNLVCPAEFDTGAHFNLVILSVPEGDDKPLKYPLMFEKADAVLINKIDAAEVFDFDMERVTAAIRTRNDHAAIFPISALNGEGVNEFCAWLSGKVQEVTEA